MLSPSDFNNAVPQFTNGNYASNPINPQYIAEPDAESYNRGTEPLQTLPAQWWNWFINKFTARFNKVNIYVKNIFNELAQVLSIFNITPDGTEQTPTTSQLKTVFETCYPQYVKTETTGTAVGCIPTVGTALGTTNNNILVTDSTGKLKPSGITVGTAAGCDAALFARKTEVDALYGNVVGTALGTAAVGTCTTFARSDHVHPVTGLATTCMDSQNYPGLGNAGDYVEFLRATQCGFIPYCEDATTGSGYIGTNTWPFYEINAKIFCGTLCGNADTVDNYHVYCCTSSYNLLRAVRGVDAGTCGNGYYAGMTNANLDGVNKWWHIISTDWMDYDPTHWISQLFLPTENGGVPKYRHNDTEGTDISQSTIHSFITDENIGSQSVNYATSAGLATCANQLYAVNAGYTTWCWSGQSGQPKWLWGSNDGTIMCVWNPANLNVNCASCAGVTCAFGNVIATKNSTMRTWSVYALKSGSIDSVPICDIAKAVRWATDNFSSLAYSSVTGFIGDRSAIYRIKGSATGTGFCAYEQFTDSGTCDWTLYSDTCTRGRFLPISFSGSY